MIKVGGKPLKHHLVKLFNKVISDAKTPGDWSKLIINPIHKKGDKTMPSNYRAIALMSIAGKVFFRIVENHISTHVENSLFKNQFCFRSGRSTIDAIFIASQLIEKAQNHQRSICYHFIDFKAAFDTVWREGYG